jgi:phosphoserine phosphatase RsbU/P
MKPAGIGSSLAAKITLMVLLGTAGVLAFVLVYSGYSSQQIIRQDAETSAVNLARLEALRLDLDLGAVAKIAENLASALEYGVWTEETINGLILRVVKENPRIFGTTVAFERYAFRSDVKGYAPYFCKGQSGLEYSDLATASYDYLHKDWYRRPLEMNSAVWSPPYFDEGGGNVLMTTYSCPFYQPKDFDKPRKIKGVITADVSLNQLAQMVSEIRVEETGYAFLVSEQGVFLAHPKEELIMQESLFSLAKKYSKPELAEIARDMDKKESGFVDMGQGLTGRDSFLAYARVPSTGWSLGVVYPKSELFAEVTELHRIIGGVAVAGVILLASMSFLVARSIAGPLRRLARVTTKVAEGNLDIDLPVSARRDEVGQLWQAFGQMTEDLKKHIEELTRTTAAKERVESELSIAAQIQRSMLPSVFPAFPGRDEFDIHALMRPARAVGGDFYDFLLVDDRHLFVAVGDVSGKGMPAALFMSVTKYLVEAAVGEGSAPDEILRRVNVQLVRNNESCMFVTAFVGILNLEDGEFVYANAGHNPPLLLRPGRDMEFLERPGGPVLGILDDGAFSMSRIVLSPGAMLILYSDGVTEAFNVEDEAFSDKRLCQAMSSAGDKSAKEAAEMLLHGIDSFCAGAPQADDITIVTLVFRRLSSQIPKEL